MITPDGKITIKSKLKDLLKSYYVHTTSYNLFRQQQQEAEQRRKNGETDVRDVNPLEIVRFIHIDEYNKLTTYAQDDYLPMTQGQLAELTGLRPNSITEMVRLKQSSINMEHLTKIATVLNLKSISDILDFVVEE
ncbi:hypothetical protein NS115_03720 [Paenibacillus jamilae]|uniref:Uncharacterized protein n=1 Tax=Paenibacillus jamilae TaxID=114136 RepID=A0ACC4ZZP6_9BACL|nr:helix-turn-helix transcriptional regulator [Paenibacillus jamilae]KTS84447.1 hypothetical protein NS115_03720 [Paenibacillus jamilae]